MKSIYVGTLPFTCSEDEVRDLFSAYGAVHSVKMISDRETGWLCGFAFVVLVVVVVFCVFFVFFGFVFSLQADTATEAAALLVLLLARHPPRPTRCCRDGRLSFTATVPACATACRMCVVIVMFWA